MTLQTIIAEKLSRKNIKDIAIELGYSSEEKVLIRINKIINSPYLSLDQSTFDFRFSTPELIRNLCEILDIPLLMCNKIIDEIQHKLMLQSQAFKPYIFIDTNFKRSNQPIFALAASEGYRYIDIGTEITDLSLNDQIAKISNIIKKHYTEHPVLPLWGDIQKYAYYYEENIVVVYSTSGELLDVVTDYVCFRAKMDLVKVLMN